MFCIHPKFAIEMNLPQHNCSVEKVWKRNRAFLLRLLSKQFYLMPFFLHDNPFNVSLNSEFDCFQLIIHVYLNRTM